MALSSFQAWQSSQSLSISPSLPLPSLSFPPLSLSFFPSLFLSYCLFFFSFRPLLSVYPLPAFSESAAEDLAVGLGVCPQEPHPFRSRSLINRTHTQTQKEPLCTRAERGRDWTVW